MFSFSSPIKSFSWLEQANQDWDIIIVGSSPSGCVLANRLSEDGRTKVLLLEAGESNANKLWSKIPATWSRTLWSSYDWQHATTPQRHLDNRRLSWPRGKLLGGSSSVNVLIYHHCAPSDYDEWEKMGCEGWGYESLREPLKRSEGYTPSKEHEDVDLEERGTEGPWKTGFGKVHPVSRKFVQAAEEVGIPYNPDFNTPRGTVGVSQFLTFVDQKGHRSSAATAYLTPDVLARPNLTVVTSTLTTRVLLSRDGKRAVGVEVADEKKRLGRFTVLAKKEVILAAGTINTPQLLMLSGIGPRDQLEAHNIPVKHELPHVGQNLQDHLQVPVLFRAKKGRTLDWLVRSPLRALPCIIRWLLGLKGTMTTNFAECVAFFRTDDKNLNFQEEDEKIPYECNANPGAPDIEIMGVPAGVVKFGKAQLPKGTDAITLMPYLLQPESKGSITLRSESPFDYPAIDPNYLSTQTDVTCLVRGVRIAMRIARSQPLAEDLALRDVADPNTIVSEEEEAYNLGDAHEGKLSDAQIATWCKRKAETLFHPTGTARMGQSGEDSVVDTRLRVHGLQGLRVCDASVFPRIVSGHTMAPVIAVAERAADLIQQELA
ncbi:glucose dehydrogenase [Dacryopinax primogenitus]|uniref:Glucose dehydrogenase n=1 Tax=Dacryopinax primogenitus (strain DJM 731) TaxID=1858805 RepID=M5G778_DACPD|nr:glucose dehydrogenase [Dacryopinax primogenitus]EJT99617.1 glucose dehydrogenase [Dacryopinax primogenitus]